MRVLHLIPSISPLRGGPSQAVLSMVVALRQQGVESSTLTSKGHEKVQLGDLILRQRKAHWCLGL